MFGKFALIIDHRVDNITNAESDFLDTLVSAEQIDEYVLIDFEPEPHVGDSYIDGVFSAYVPPLAVAKAQKLADFQTDVLQYIEDRYPLLTRIQFMNLYMLAKFQGLTSRSAYIEPGLSWLSSILAYVVSFSASVNAQTDAATVMAMTWDINANVSANPNLTLAGAISLTGTPVTLDPISATEKAFFNAKITSLSFSPSTPTRTLNSNFTPSETQYVLCIYSIKIVATATLSSNQNAVVELRSDTSTPPTTVRCAVESGVNLTLGVAVGFSNSQTGVLMYLVPPGHNVRLVSTVTGSPSVSILQQTEIPMTVSLS